MIKKRYLLITALLTIVALSAQAQEALTTGNRILGGGISFGLSESSIGDQDNNFDPNSNYESSSFKISPYYGRFIDDNKLLGISLTVGSENNNRKNKSDYGSESEWSNTSFGTGVFLRWYFPISERTGVYFQPGSNYNYLIHSNRFTIYSDSSQLTISNKSVRSHRSHAVSLSAKVGLYFFIFDQLSIETNLGNFVANLQFNNSEQETGNIDNVNKTKATNSSLNLNFVNSFTFDQLFTINYYF